MGGSTSAPALNINRASVATMVSEYVTESGAKITGEVGTVAVEAFWASAEVSGNGKVEAGKTDTTTSSGSSGSSGRSGGSGGSDGSSGGNAGGNTGGDTTTKYTYLQHYSYS